MDTIYGRCLERDVDAILEEWGPSVIGHTVDAQRNLDVVSLCAEVKRLRVKAKEEHTSLEDPSPCWCGFRGRVPLPEWVKKPHAQFLFGGELWVVESWGSSNAGLPGSGAHFQDQVNARRVVETTKIASDVLLSAAFPK